MKSGIYKITSPVNQIYIGQSIDTEKRILHYHTVPYSYRNQIKLLRSFEKYGIENHKFEIIEYCSIKKLNNKERYWQDFYKVLENGLNLILTKSDSQSGKRSEETINKIRKTLTGKTYVELYGSIEEADNQKKKRKDKTVKQWKNRTEQDRINVSNKISKKLKKYFKEHKIVHTLVKCPHCNKEGKGNSMKRWHFDNCKNISNENIQLR